MLAPLLNDDCLCACGRGGGAGDILLAFPVDRLHAFRFRFRFRHHRDSMFRKLASDYLSRHMEMEVHDHERIL